MSSDFAQENANEIPSKPKPRWQPLNSMDRRVLGVLAEKAKTTPDAYPLTLNAICTGANQKSNRDPLMQLEPETVEESLDRLREMGAVGIVEGYGRVPKYRHYLYEWLGVEKVELSVMTELLLRGDQTVGELRTRASRMDPIADIAALRNLLNVLKAKNLIVFLTPEGRGQVVSHNLYKPREMETLQAKYAGAVSVAAYEEDDAVASSSAQPSAGSAAPAISSDASSRSVTHALSHAPSIGASEEARRLRHEIEELKLQLHEVKTELETLSADYQQTVRELHDLKNALGG